VNFLPSLGVENGGERENTKVLLGGSSAQRQKEEKGLALPRDGPERKKRVEGKKLGERRRIDLGLPREKI